MSDLARAEFYDIISDPAKRLAHEGDFLLWLLSTAPGDRVLDAAAATGAHAEFLARHGARVTGRDIDAEAIEYARGRRSAPGLVFETGDMREAAGGQFDLIICMGNSLSMLESAGDVRLALRAFRREASPGGVAFAHVINYRRFQAGPPRQKVARRATPGGEIVIVKDMVPAEKTGALVSFAYFLRNGERWQSWGHQASLLDLTKDFLEDAARGEGFDVEAAFGDYDKSAFDPSSSPDLLLVLRAR